MNKAQKLFNDFNAHAGFYKIDEDVLDQVSNEDALNYEEYGVKLHIDDYTNDYDERKDSGLAEINMDNTEDLSEDEWEKEEEVPFEERDIIAERVKEYKEHHKGDVAEEQKHNPELEYSLSEFKLMEDAHKFKTLTSKETQDLLEKNRPISKETKEPITEAELRATLKKYYAIKDKGNWGDYTGEEIGFMKQCSNWNRINNEAKRKNPVMAKGQLLNEKQIDELSLEYTKLRSERPERK